MYQRDLVVCAGITWGSKSNEVVLFDTNTLKWIPKDVMSEYVA